jgi:hypothetical protein
MAERPAKRTVKKAAPAKRTVKKAAPAKRTVKKAAPAKRTVKKAAPAKVSRNNYQSTERSSLSIPEVPLKSSRVTAASQASVTKYQTEATEDFKPAKEKQSSKRKTKPLLITVFLIALVAVFFGGVIPSESSNSEKSSSVSGEQETIPPTPTTPPAPTKNPVEETLREPSSDKTFEISYEYNSTGIRIFIPRAPELPEVSRTTLLYSKNSASLNPILSVPGKTNSLKLVKIDTVGQSRFVFEFELQNGSKVKSKPISLPGEFARS